MKFLCVPCDKPMALQETRGPDRGSVSLVYGCDDCGYEMAMLTNPFETQLVSSLGVKIGPDGEKVEAQGESKCPFTGMMQDMSADAAKTAPAGETTLRWTEQAVERLSSIPSFIRPMAKSGIEKFAIEKGYSEVDETVLAEARSHFGM